MSLLSQSSRPLPVMDRNEGSGRISAVCLNAVLLE